MKKILFVNHPEKRCGVYQYGAAVFEALNKGNEYQFHYVECSSGQELDRIMQHHAYWGVLYNYHDVTLSFVDPAFVKRYPDIVHICLAHELTEEIVSDLDGYFFDYYIYADPSLSKSSSRVFKIGRLLPEYVNSFPLPKTLTIGSYGFQSGMRKFENLIKLTQREFDEAVIRINIPINDVVDQAGAHARCSADRCMKLVKKPGIKVEITHEFFDKTQLLDFLAQNTINVFTYDELGPTGISSAVDLALAVRRPIAVSDSNFFRHLYSIRPSVILKSAFWDSLYQKARALARAVYSRKKMVYFKKYTSSLKFFVKTIFKVRSSIERSSLKEIVNRGFSPLEPIYQSWQAPQFINEFNAILQKIEEISLKAKSPKKSFNGILNDLARIKYEPSIKDLGFYAPKIIKKKIKRANIQQAFVYDTVKYFARMNSKILCVGGYEDTACYALEKLGYKITNIDPEINCDLDSFFNSETAKKNSFDVIFSTSVIEHVPDDLKLFAQVVQLLKPGGYGIFTCDFKYDYKVGDYLFPCNHRFYTKDDLLSRVMPALMDCSLVDEADWSCSEPDFEHGGLRYTFATLVFRKNEYAQI